MTGIVEEWPTIRLEGHRGSRDWRFAPAANASGSVQTGLSKVPPPDFARSYPSAQAALPISPNVSRVLQAGGTSTGWRYPRKNAEGFRTDSLGRQVAIPLACSPKPLRPSPRPHQRVARDRPTGLPLGTQPPRMSALPLSTRLNHVPIRQILSAFSTVCPKPGSARRPARRRIRVGGCA